MSRAILVFFLITVIKGCYGRKETYCSLDFSLVGTKCYHISTENLTWDDAFYDCLGRNSSLAILKNEKEARTLKKYLKFHFREFGFRGRWVGSRYDWKNGRWIWGESGEPVRLRGIQPGNQQWDCLTLNIGRTNIWMSESCLRRRGFVCEKKTRRPLPIRRKFDKKICRKNYSNITESQRKKCLKLAKASRIPSSMTQIPESQKEYVCPSNMFVIKNKCYHFSQNKLNWDDAYWSCRDNNSYLAVVLSKYQNDRLVEFLDSGLVGRHERWLGGLYDWKQKRWLWANSGVPIKYQGFPFKNYTGTQFEWRSTTIDPNIGNMWNARLRTEANHFICQTKAKTILKLKESRK